jgi:ceramide glucosyltransferase
VILSGIFAGFALLSLALVVWQWLAARCFPLHRRNPLTGPAPGITLLKPLKGCDEHTEDCLRSWLVQEYPGQLQILFGVAEDGDPACAVVSKLKAEFPRLEVELVFCRERLGPNEKVSKLAKLEAMAKHELVVVSDADVRAPADLLSNLITPLLQHSSQVALSTNESQPVGDTDDSAPAWGLVSCFYRFANPTTLAMRWEAIAVNADFWSQVLQNASFRKLEFALGAVVATRRELMAEAGGFRALVNQLADDYQLGRRLAQRGRRLGLCPVVVECWSAKMGWRQVWRHQLRWARTIRACQPFSYFLSILNNVTMWSLAWVVATGAISALESHTLAPNEFGFPLASPAVWVLATGSVAIRVLLAVDLQRRLSPSSRSPWCWSWFVPVKDLLQVAIWAVAFLGNHVEWCGRRYRLQLDGSFSED